MDQLTPAQRQIADAMIESTMSDPRVQPLGWTADERSAGPPGPMQRLFADPSTWSAPMAAGSSGVAARRVATTRVPYTDMPTLNPYLRSGGASLNEFMGQPSPRLSASHSGKSVAAALAPMPKVNPAVQAAAAQAAGGVPLPRPRPNVLPSELGYTPMEDANIAAGLKAGVPLKSVAMPRPRPGWAPTAQDVAIMKAGVARNPDLIELLIRGGTPAAPVKPVVIPQQAAQLAARAAQSKAYGATSGVPRTGRDPERESGNVFFRSGFGGGGGGGSLL